MENINWLLTLLVGAFISIPFGIITNLVTPKIQTYIDKRNLSSRGKTLAQLKNEYDRIKWLHDNPHELQLRVNIRLAHGIAGVYLFLFFLIGFLISSYIASISNSSPSIQIGAVVASMFLALILFIIFNIGEGRMMKLHGDLTRIRDFEEYESKHLAKIAELEHAITKK